MGQACTAHAPRVHFSVGTSRSGLGSFDACIFDLDDLGPDEDADQVQTWCRLVAMCM